MNKHPESSVHFGPKLVEEQANCLDLLRSILERSPQLQTFLRGASEAVEPVLLIVNDSHRATLTREALLVLGELFTDVAKGLRFHLLVACGTHEFSAAEMRLFEEDMLRNVTLSIDSIEWHDARSKTLHRSIGEFEFHHWLSEFRFLLPIGSVEPHYFAGVTGPHKTVTIGCMSHECIRQNHRGALDPASDILQLAGNPIHDGVVRALDSLSVAGKRICCIGEVASGHALVAAAAGPPLTVVDELVPTAIKTFVHEINEPFDILHLKVPMPLGRSLYQADKAIKNNHRAVRDGGGIILEAECPEGIGASSFMHLLRKAPTLASARALVNAQGYALGDHKAIKLREMTDPNGRGIQVALVSKGINASDARAAGMTLCADVPAAFAWLRGRESGRLNRVAIISDAGFVTVATNPASR